jgi:regulator of ribonuclease activity B
MAKIEKAMLVEMFANIRSQTKWSIDGDMLWGYFFTDSDRTKLLTSADELSRRGYRVVGVHEPTPEDDDQTILWLHVERIETHSPDSLHRRNQELYQFADEMALGSYDGMDVGPASAV